MPNLVPTSFHVSRAQDLVRSFYNQDTYYLFVGDHVPNPNDGVASPVVAGTQLNIDVFDNMIQGKLIQPTDVSLMVPRVVWTTNTSYPAFSNSKAGTCHVAVESGTTYNVYKCLFNNNTNSTVAPTGTDALPFTLGDGYVWKYIYSVTKTVYDKFKTATKMPFVANTVNQTAAIPGTVDVISVSAGGVGYNNYLVSQFRAGDIAVTPTTYKLVETASNLNNFYAGCIIKVTSPGSPAVGQYRRITGYAVTGNVKTITLESAFTSTPNPTDAYEIYPEVRVSSSNPFANVAIAMAIVNPAQANTIGSVEVLFPGSNHRTATATVLKDSSVGVITAASVTPVVSPVAGHGGNPTSELKASTVGFSTSITPADANSAFSSVANDYRQIGIIRNPKFSNTTCTANGTGFTVGEPVVQYKVVGQLSFAANLIATTLTGDANATFTSTFQQGDVVMVANTTAQRLVTINSVANNSSATVVENVGNILGTPSLVRLVADAVIKTSNTTSFVLDSASPTIAPLLPIYGTASYTVKTPSAISLNSGSNSSVFIQATRLVGSTHTGAFTADELITGPTGTGRFHSYTANGATWTVAVTSITGHLDFGDTITGQTSGASMVVSAKYSGDLTPDKGHIVYIENIIPVTRASNKTENFRIALEL
jgi:hypothetical protein